MPRDPYNGPKPTRPKQAAQKAEPCTENEETTKVRCPTCTNVSAVGVGKLGCVTCAGEGFITVERYLEMTERCPTYIGSGRITNEQGAALVADALRRESGE